jgi:hypothetical protein
MTLELRRPGRKAPDRTSVISPSMPSGSGPMLTQRAAVILALALGTTALAALLNSPSVAHVVLAAVFGGSLTFFNQVVS